MGSAIISFTSIIFYCIAAGGQAYVFLRGHSRYRLWILGTGVVAVLGHAWVVFEQTLSPQGVNISIYSMGSLVSWFIALTVLISSMRKPLENLLIVLLPLSALMILFSVLNPDASLILDQMQGNFASHIILAVLAYSFLTIAAFHSLVLLYQHTRLKRPGHLNLLKALPPMQTMESLLFELIWVGWAFLTLSIASGFLYLEDMFDQQVVHHTILTLAAWVVFLILLIGRVALGWRAGRAIKWTLAGFCLLLVGYFGSKLVLEVILAGT